VSRRVAEAGDLLTLGSKVSEAVPHDIDERELSGPSLPHLPSPCGPDGWVGSVQWRRGPGQGTRTSDFPADRIREDNRDLTPPDWTRLKRTNAP
jgi:hypothetical protein